MKLFHGSAINTAPVIRVGAFIAGKATNIFDGLFASPERETAECHGDGYVYTYDIPDEKIAESLDLDNRYEEVWALLRSELEIDDVKAIADCIMWDNSHEAEDFLNIMSPRQSGGASEAAFREMQRLRGRVAAHLGYDAVEMYDEYDVSYLIVNPEIIACNENATG